MRWPVELPEEELVGQPLNAINRRGKYLLFEFDQGVLMLHLGMSGHLQVVSQNTPIKPHDHIDFVFGRDRVLRFNDPRRFGSVHWSRDDIHDHTLLRSLGLEPLSEQFDADYLHASSRRRKVAVKNFIMDSHVVVGVGNIYANESLFRAGIRPTRAAGRISIARYERLAEAIKSTLSEAIKVGGTTLRDFVDSGGQPGYFSQQLDVYGRAGEDCVNCNHPLNGIVLGQRQTVYCPRCQRS